MQKLMPSVNTTLDSAKIDFNRDATIVFIIPGPLENAPEAGHSLLVPI